MSIKTLFNESSIPGISKLKVPEDETVKSINIKEFVAEANPLVVFYPHNGGDFTPLVKSHLLPSFARNFLRYDMPLKDNTSLLWINMNINPIDFDKNDRSRDYLPEIIANNEFMGVAIQGELGDITLKGEYQKLFRCYYFFAGKKEDPNTDKTIIFFTFGIPQDIISDIFIKYGIGFYVPPDLNRIY